MKKVNIAHCFSYALVVCALSAGVCGCGNSDASFMPGSLAACLQKCFSGKKEAESVQSARSDSPEEVFLYVIRTIQSGSCTRAFLKEHCTEDCARIWGDNLSALERDVSGSFSIEDTRINGDQATVYYRRNGGKRDRFKMMKIDGKWKMMLN